MEKLFFGRALVNIECSDRCSFFPQALSWSPDGTRLAVDVWLRGGYQYVGTLDASGGQKTQDYREIHAEWSMSPAWSPDGTRIAFVCYRENENPDICTIDVHSGKETRLTNDPAMEANPVWSPDGTRLAFVSGRDGNWEIYTILGTKAMSRRPNHGDQANRASRGLPPIRWHCRLDRCVNLWLA